MKHPEQMTTAAIGKLVQAERKRQELTQLQLADMAGTGIRLISHFGEQQGDHPNPKAAEGHPNPWLGVSIFSPWENTRPIAIEYAPALKGIHQRIRQVTSA